MIVDNHLNTVWVVLRNLALTSVVRSEVCKVNEIVF